MALSPDESICVDVQDLINPLRNIPLENYNYVAFEGNIGAGKTTLTTKISEDFNAKTVLERIAGNPFLPKFYKDQKEYRFFSADKFYNYNIL